MTEFIATVQLTIKFSEITVSNESYLNEKKIFVTRVIRQIIGTGWRCVRDRERRCGGPAQIIISLSRWLLTAMVNRRVPHH